jgi:RNA polymerase sigma-70 factor (ECF subfamily)
MDNISNPNHKYRDYSDEQLLEMSLDRDQNSYKELVLRYIKPISIFIHGYIKNEDETEDIVQDTFFKVWKNLHKFDSKNKFKPWLYKIARNTVLDQIKKKKALSFSYIDENSDEFSNIDDSIIEENNIGDKIDNIELLKKVKNQIDQIHPEYRSVLILHYEEELTFEEIGNVMNKPMNTVKSWHRRAINKLKKFFTD